MTIITFFLLIILSAIVLIPFVRVKWKGIITVTTVIAIAILSSSIAFHTLAGESFEYLLQGSLVTGKIPIGIDALSGWFILVINFTLITGAFYGYNI